MRWLLLLGVSVLAACGQAGPLSGPEAEAADTVTVPAAAETLVADNPAVDADDPVLWRDPADPARALWIGTDKSKGLYVHDMAGNVSEWVADCWHQGYRRAPATGAAWINPGCRNRMYRGGSWASAPAQVRSAWRASGGTDATNARIGFRLVRQI